MPSKQFYASSNGDTWELVRDGDRVLVLHRPNLASGGVPRHVELGAFLAHEPHTAQNVALVRLIGALVSDEGVRELTGTVAAASVERDEQAVAQAAGVELPGLNGG